MSHRVAERFGFEAAHLLPRVAMDHKCRRLHGHSYRLELLADVTGESERAAMRSAAEDLVQRLDYRVLNHIEGLDNPTAENIVRWVSGRLEGPWTVRAIRLAETCESACVFLPARSEESR